MVIPSLQNVQVISEIMARTLQDLHIFIEKESIDKDPRETIVLMLSFITGITMQLRDKLDVLGCAINRAIKYNNKKRL